MVLRNEYKQNLETLSRRIRNCVTVKIDEEPKEDPLKLVDEYLKITKKLENLIVKINHRNLTTELSGGDVIADAIAYKNRLIQDKNILEQVLFEAVGNGYGRESTKSTVKIEEIQKRISAISKEYREINNEIQAINWLTDL